MFIKEKLSKELMIINNNVAVWLGDVDVHRALVAVAVVKVAPLFFVPGHPLNDVGKSLAGAPFIDTPCIEPQLEAYQYWLVRFLLSFAPGSSKSSPSRRLRARH